MNKTTAVIDSPEALGVALCRHVPDMANGFTITTRDCKLQLTISAEDTRPFMVAMERLLKGKIRQIQRGHQGLVLDEKLDRIEATNQILAEQIRREDKINANNLQATWQLIMVTFPTLTSEERECIDQIIRTAALRKTSI